MGEQAENKEQTPPTEAKPEEKKEEKQPEEKKEEKGEDKPEEKEEPKPPSPFVLYVDLHCVGCAKKIERSLMKIRGVEGISIDMASNQVTIKGIVDPQAVCTRITKKTKRRAKVISPLPAAEGEPMPEVVTSQVSGATTVELNINMHCEACAEQLKRKILKMRGVQKAETELSTGKVTVCGTMEATKLVEYVYRRTKKQARIVPQPEPEDQKPAEKEEVKKEAEAETQAEAEKPEAAEAKPDPAEKKPLAEETKKEDKGEEAKKGGEAETNQSEEETLKMMQMQHYYQPLYVFERVPPPQLFSDENPNACCIS